MDILKMKPHNLFFGILIVVAGMQVLVTVVLALVDLKEGMEKYLINAFLLSFLSSPLIYFLAVKNTVRRRSEPEAVSVEPAEKDTGPTIAEEKLELGNRLMSLINNVQGMVYRGHRDWSLSVIGAEVEPVTGYTAKEFMSGAVSWKDIIHPDDQGWLKDTFRKAVRERLKSLRVEYRIRHRNGDIRWVADRRQVMYDETGSFAYVDGLLLDITRRKDLETALKESEARFRAIFEGSKDGILLVDVESMNFVTGNQAICDLLQYSLDEIPSLKVTDIHPVDDLPWILDSFERQARREFQVAMDIPVKRKDGSVFFADIKSGPATIAGKQCLIGNFRDVTERKRTEETLTRLGMAVDQAAEAVVVTDTEGGIEYVNPAFERITGYSREEAVGRNMRILKSGRHEERFYEEMWAALSRGEVWRGRFINRRKDGSLYEEEETISPVRDPSGKIVNFVAGKRDITQEVLLQKQLRTAQRMESVGTLAGGVAHDFNNALTGVLGFGEMLKHRLADDPKALSDVDQILRSAERASTLTRQLLTFARRQVIEPVNLDLGKIVQDLAKLLRKVIGEHIEVETILREDLPSVFADPGQMEQVLMNLCLNARDAMPSGGRLVIRTEVTTIGEEYVKAHPYSKEGRYVVLNVSDTGIGMDEKTIERIFEPFFSTKGPEKGTGLGLAVVYGIVKQHNGYIHVSSDPGKGTTFEIRLPAGDTLPDARPAAKEDPVRGGDETILLTEDDESVRMLAERILKQRGYKVLCARNGEEAIDVFKENGGNIHLAILDVIMPTMGGKEAFEEMRRTNPALKVVYMSGYTANAIHESFVLTAGVPFLQKPFSPGTLAGKVREVLDSREP